MVEERARCKPRPLFLCGDVDSLYTRLPLSGSRTFGLGYGRSLHHNLGSS